MTSPDSEVTKRPPTDIASGEGHGHLARIFMLIVVLGTLALVAVSFLNHPRSFEDMNLAFWVLVLATVELLPVPVSRVLQLSLGFPIRLGIAILYPPFVAAGVALLGSFDSRELKHEITPLKSMFNRCQIALSTLASAAILHYFSTDPVRLPTLALVPAALAATVANYSVNVALVALAMRLLYNVSIRDVLGQLRVGAL